MSVQKNLVKFSQYSIMLMTSTVDDAYWHIIKSFYTFFFFPGLYDVFLWFSRFWLKIKGFLKNRFSNIQTGFQTEWSQNGKDHDRSWKFKHDEKHGFSKPRVLMRNPGFSLRPYDFIGSWFHWYGGYFNSKP